jgi:hypothetical protein
MFFSGKYESALTIDKEDLAKKYQLKTRSCQATAKK